DGDEQAATPRNPPDSDAGCPGEDQRLGRILCDQEAHEHPERRKGARACRVKPPGPSSVAVILAVPAERTGLFKQYRCWPDSSLVSGAGLRARRKLSQGVDLRRAEACTASNNQD